MDEEQPSKLDPVKWRELVETELDRIGTSAEGGLPPVSSIAVGKSYKGDQIWVRKASTPKLSGLDSELQPVGSGYRIVAKGPNKSTFDLLFVQERVVTVLQPSVPTLVVALSTESGIWRMRWRNVDRWADYLMKEASRELGDQLAHGRFAESATSQFFENFRHATDEEKIAGIADRFGIKIECMPIQYSAAWNSPVALWKLLVLVYVVVPTAGSMFDLRLTAVDRWLARLMNFGDSSIDIGWRVDDLLRWLSQMDRRQANVSLTNSLGKVEIVAEDPCWDDFVTE